MVKRPPFLVGIEDFLNKPTPLPEHAFHLGEDGHANVGQFPNFRYMAFHVIGKAPAPMPDGTVDTLGMGIFALGGLIGDACLKLARPWPLAPGDRFVADPAQGLIVEIADGLLPLSPKADAVRGAFLCRMGEFLEIVLHQPERLPAIIANVDALTNARLTERAAAILRTGVDPGAADLWQSASPLDL